MQPGNLAARIRQNLQAHVPVLHADILQTVVRQPLLTAAHNPHPDRLFGAKRSTNVQQSAGFPEILIRIGDNNTQ
jgi:hypothetical protein